MCAGDYRRGAGAVVWGVRISALDNGDGTLSCDDVGASAFGASRVVTGRGEPLMVGYHKSVFAPAGHHAM